jgi:hypothetical protein
MLQKHAERVMGRGGACRMAAKDDAVASFLRGAFRVAAGARACCAQYTLLLRLASNLTHCALLRTHLYAQSLKRRRRIDIIGAAIRGASAAAKIWRRRENGGGSGGDKRHERRAHQGGVISRRAKYRASRHRELGGRHRAAAHKMRRHIRRAPPHKPAHARRCGAGMTRIKRRCALARGVNRRHQRLRALSGKAT